MKASFLRPFAIGLALAMAASMAFAGGGADFAYPVGAVSCSYRIFDEDVFYDDLLATGTEEIPDGAAAGDDVTIDFDDLYCKDGDVQGPEGSSGEQEAEIIVEVTWKFPSGATSTVTSRKQVLRCREEGGLQPAKP